MSDLAVCQMCGAIREIGVPDYNPFQYLIGSALGWYSSEKDGEMCPGCLRETIDRANGLI